jgi:hypothetical protein
MSEPVPPLLRLMAISSFVALLFAAIIGKIPVTDETVQIADQQVQQSVEEQAERKSNTLTVPRATSTIVFVGDASSEYGRKWLNNEATQCEAKGWQIKTVDLSGMSDPKFFIFSGGVWMTHNGHLSLSSLSALVSRTTATQSQPTGPLPSVAPRRASE